MYRLIGVVVVGLVVKGMQLGQDYAPALPGIEKWMTFVRIALLCVLSFQLYCLFNELIELAVPVPGSWGAGMASLKMAYWQRWFSISMSPLDARMKEALRDELKRWFRIEMRKLTSPREEDTK